MYATQAQARYMTRIRRAALNETYGTLLNPTLHPALRARLAGVAQAQEDRLIEALRAVEAFDEFAALAA